MYMCAVPYPVSVGSLHLMQRLR